MIENVVRLKIHDLHMKKEAGEIHGLDAKAVRELYDKALATAKAGYVLGLDLRKLSQVEFLHRKYCR